MFNRRAHIKETMSRIIDKSREKGGTSPDKAATIRSLGITKILIFSLLGITIIICLAVGLNTYMSVPSDGANQPGRLLGWRLSMYSHQQDKKPTYWVDTARAISTEVPHSDPSGVWIIGKAQGASTILTFPSSTSHRHIQFTSTDQNEKYLTAFDNAGLKIWLQVEPANANIGTLIDLVLGRYKNHSCIIGFGVDVEWYETSEYNNGKPVTNTEAQSWLNKVKSHGNYRLFLKHWLPSKLPTIQPDGLVFISDSQDFSNLDDMVQEFKEWGQHFSQSNVCFQIGYEADRIWWSKIGDPVGTIARTLISNVPNCEGVYWVDFTILEVFP